MQVIVNGIGRREIGRGWDLRQGDLLSTNICPHSEQSAYYAKKDETRERN